MVIVYNYLHRAQFASQYRVDQAGVHFEQFNSFIWWRKIMCLFFIRHSFRYSVCFRISSTFVHFPWPESTCIQSKQLWLVGKAIARTRSILQFRFHSKPIFLKFPQSLQLCGKERRRKNLSQILSQTQIKRSGQMASWYDNRPCKQIEIM